MPFQAVYAATKHALAGWKETLDLEVRPFGIRAILIQPGFFRTDIDRNSSVGSLPKDVYEGVRTRTVEKMRLSEGGRSACRPHADPFWCLQLPLPASPSH
jgi:NAD(P)-dependent dehydrogenase (short-subunit alcohol dehydrogenase family)